ncbi:hypothetical protein A4G27_09880 [Mycobacterium kansasii]|nr:hypothetical protein A4G27_09880 [Mycobacterium kansasii]
MAGSHFATGLPAATGDIDDVVAKVSGQETRHSSGHPMVADHRPAILLDGGEACDALIATSDR